MRLLLPWMVIWSGAAAPLLAEPSTRRDKAILTDDTDQVARKLAAQVPDGPPVPLRERVLKAEPGGLEVPRGPSAFLQAWHQSPVCQGLTGQCWAFAMTSFLESEVHHQSRREVELSPMYVAYWEFVEKARGYVATKGASEFGRGSEPDAAIRIWRQYGAVPAAAYPGRQAGRDFYVDRTILAEMREVLASAKARGEWNEAQVIARIRRVLDRHMGPPPERVALDGQNVTPPEYFRRAVQVDLDQYVSVLSLMQEPYDAWCEYRVPDNWWHSKAYWNVRIDAFMRIARETLAGGRTLCLGFDNTEPGFLRERNFAFVPTFDIAAERIDDAARQLRFTTEATTDDHAVHLIGMHAADRATWYLIKDSGTKAWSGPHPGYVLLHEDYLRLKGLILLAPRACVEKALRRTLP